MRLLTTMRRQDNSIVPHFIFSFNEVWDKAPRHQANKNKGIRKICILPSLVSWCLGGEMGFSDLLF
jgi:hypothetical protein